MATSFPAPSKFLEIAQLKSREVFFYDVAEISTSRPLQRRPLHKMSKRYLCRLHTATYEYFTKPAEYHLFIAKITKVTI